MKQKPTRNSEETFLQCFREEELRKIISENLKRSFINYKKKIPQQIPTGFCNKGCGATLVLRQCLKIWKIEGGGGGQEIEGGGGQRVED